MPHPILNEDRSDYDNRKIRDSHDTSKVSCEEAWELNYLVKKLHKYFPEKTEFDIRTVMSTCCTNIKAPRNRVDFIDCVTTRLSSVLLNL